jgi:hypothetical protein
MARKTRYTCIIFGRKAVLRLPLEGTRQGWKDKAKV